MASSPGMPLLDASGPLNISPLSQVTNVSLNDSSFPDPVRHLDFEDVRLEIELDELGVEDVVGEQLERVEVRDEAAVGVEEGEEEDDEDEGNDVDDDASGQGHPLRVRRSDRVNKGVPPIRFQAGP